MQFEEIQRKFLLKLRGEEKKKGIFHFTPPFWLFSDRCGNLLTRRRESNFFSFRFDATGFSTNLSLIERSSNFWKFQNCRMCHHRRRKEYRRVFFFFFCNGGQIFAAPANRGKNALNKRANKRKWKTKKKQFRNATNKNNGERMKSMQKKKKKKFVVYINYRRGLETIWLDSKPRGNKIKLSVTLLSRTRISLYLRYNKVPWSRWLN